MLKKWSIILLMIMASIAIARQNDEQRVYRTNPEYELDDWIGYSMTRWIRSIAQGTEYVYLATTGGISRYNYLLHKWDYPFTSSSGLAANDIYVVAYDFDTSYLWCATSVSLSCYFPTFQRWENYYFDEMGLTLATPIISIGFNRDHVWAETEDGKIFRGDKHGGGNFVREYNISNEVLSSIRWDGYRNQRTGALPRFFIGDGYFFHPEGYISDVDLNRYEVSSWLVDKWGYYWVATLGLGMGRAEVRIEFLNLLPYGLFLNNVSAMAYDPLNDVMWIGGVGEYQQESGITSWRITNNEWNYYRAQFIADLPSDQVTSIVVDDEPFIWVGTVQGLARYNYKKNEWKFVTIFENLTDNFVFDIARDDKNIWIATASGLSRIRKESGTDTISVDRINPRALRQIEIYDVEVQDNLVWAGTQFGVYLYDTEKDSGSFLQENGGPETSAVYAVSCYKNEVWFGIEGGIEIYDVLNRKWLGVPQRRFNSEETISYIIAEKDAVWAGTEDHGVLKFDRKRNYWRSFTTMDGLLDNRVNVLVMDGDHIWFGGPAGITRFYWNDPYRID